MAMNEDNELDEFAPWLVVLTTLIGGWLRILLLSSKGMWLDETFSVWLASHSVADMLQWIARIDHNPPLYYLLLHYWIGLNGDTPYAVRLLSALLGAATIPVIYLIGKRLSGALMGLTAAVLLAVSPFNIRYAQETRMYTLLAFNAAVAIYALARLLTDARATNPIGSQFREYIRAWRTPGPVEPDTARDFSYKDETRKQTGWRAWIYRHRWLPVQAIETDLAWVVLIVFSSATLLSHSTAIFFPLAANIFVLGLMLFQRIKKPGPLPAWQAPSLRNWVTAQIVILLLWSPWLSTLIRQAGRVFQEFWIPAPNRDIVIQALRSFLNEPTLGSTNPALVLWLLYALLLGLGLAYYRKNISSYLFLATLFTIPFLGELLISLCRPVFLDRTLIWITLPLFLAMASGIAQLRWRGLMIVALGILSVSNLFFTADYYRFRLKEDWNNPAGFVAYFAQKDDLILFNTPGGQIAFDYYFKTYESQYSLQVEKQGVPVNLSESASLDPKMTESDLPRLLALLSGRNRIWLVYSHNSYTDPDELIPRTLASEMQLLQARKYYGVQVQLYGVP